MGLSERVNRVIKANLNDIAGNFNRIEGEMFIAGGGVLRSCTFPYNPGFS
ncbi:MAG: hypothetical protein KME49_02460 [Brasilonema octagenarum HA4186-MV1]|jgi:hypothetical protein|nr:MULTISPECIES: hypothetical protein [Brasilonema]MBW4624394.1 hypothetical protein [Brasilonema octagenarum HA4186-MV1]